MFQCCLRKEEEEKTTKQEPSEIFQSQNDLHILGGHLWFRTKA